MKSYTIRPFVAGDLLKIEDRAPIANLQAFSLGKFYAKHPSITGVDLDGNIIACAGIIIMWRGVGDLWGCMSSLVPKYKLGFVKTANRFLISIVHAFDLHRVQATIAVDDLVAIRFAQHLGMGRESTLRHYGPNKENFFVYVRMT